MGPSARWRLGIVVSIESEEALCRRIDCSGNVQVFYSASDAKNEKWKPTTA